ncbi:YqcC family protein [Alteromonas lipolytica]|uniref:YqcC-like domain-containing protein n=1 Tax=Alteromonas lipolytica TaxID=1856405 RepID=A0A1E8FE73_9ALTE|nr:YqcC family protein [Alteromonas lipolytica]OFI34222.1 hypothetical protein BFC17_22055 [Alteromonas lipolytica]GGF84010.1 hypothetical protein GCM10011338_40380 [Alteromonas lipolytica]
MIRDAKLVSHGPRLLEELEAVLKAANLWSDIHLSPAALASEQPFACDTLAFEQWLQFIFIPRIRALSDAGALVPPMHILPMAEVTWQSSHQPVQQVLARFDRWSKQLHD